MAQFRKVRMFSKIFHKGYTINTGERVSGDDYSLQDAVVPNESLQADVNAVEEPQICLLKDSPKKILKRAALGDVKAVSASLQEDASRLELADSKGWTVLHHAAANGAIGVLSLLPQFEPDWSLSVENSDNALHIAIDHDQPEVCEFLVKQGIDAEWFNHDKLTAIHQAIKHKRHECLKRMLRPGKLDVHMKVDLGLSPLHYCAVLDNVEAAQILLDAGAYMCQRCSLGNTAIHYAAKNASKSVLELLLQLIEEKGYTRDYLLSIQDKYGQSPLHAAINSGSSDAVRVCLEAGANIDTKQEDGSTAIHLVCSQGALPIVRLMFEIQPDKKFNCLTAKDKSGMTPLHRAAMFDYADLVKFLVDQGSPLNMTDCHGRTPLLLAASRRNKATLMILLLNGADVAARDLENSNFLHLAVKGGGTMMSINDDKLCKELLNQSDILGCTPLHYASRDGNLPSIVSLLKCGALITSKDNSDQSPLHFASKYGRYNTCVALLDTMQGSYVINEPSHSGKTPLHLAAENGHVKVVALLLQRGALLHRDHKGFTPLHLAVMNQYTQTMKLLLNVHPSLLNTPSNERNSPLHEAAIANKPKAIALLLTMSAQIYENQDNRSFLDLAIERGNTEAAMAVINHARRDELLNMRSKIYQSYMEALIKYLPEACMAALDYSVEYSNEDSNNVDYSITYSFQLIDDEFMSLQDAPPPPGSSSSKLLSLTGKEPEPEQPEKRKRLEILRSMVKYERVKCLSHPVCLEYLKMKWSSYGMWLQLLNLLLYCTVLITFTYQMIKNNSPRVVHLNETMLNGTNQSERQIIVDKPVVGVGHYICNILILIFIFFNLIKEIFQLIHLKWRYLLDFVNLVEWLMYSTAALYTVPLLIGQPTIWSWQCGHIALFLLWVDLLLFLQRFEFFGIYVVMFMEILKTLFQVVVVFSFLYVAFGFTLYSILRYQNVDEKENNGFRSLGLSVMSSIMMMIGDINYLDTFVNGEQPYPELTFVLLAVFILLMPILLINLMIGLAVGDIASVQKNARLKRLAMQVEFLSDMEEKLPQRIINYFNKPSITIHPNHCGQTMRQWYINLVSPQDGVEDGPERNETREMLVQQKTRIKELQCEVKSTGELLKLIVQKMEIKTESTELDEGERDENVGISLILKQAARSSSSRWRSQVDTLCQENDIVKQWKRESISDTQSTNQRSTEKLSITPVDHTEL